VTKVLVAESITKRYRNGTLALSDLSLTVDRGEILCLVGPNGAGKTTTVRILATQLLPTSGRVTVFGEDAIREPAKVRSRLASVPQEGEPDLELTAWEHVYYYLRVRGLGHRTALARATEALTQLGLWEKRRQLCRLLSGGLRRRVLIAMAFAAQAELLFLDEPTTGLDPAIRRETWDLLSALRRSTTIVLTSHSMEEVEALADRVLVILDGRLRVEGRPAELRRLMPAGRKVIIDSLPSEAGRPSEEDLRPFGRVGSYAGKLVVYPETDAATEGAVREALRHQAEVAVVPTNLEDVIVALERGELS
jgi:ABC-2 type transport system ATP-binding protein